MQELINDQVVSMITDFAAFVMYIICSIISLSP